MDREALDSTVLENRIKMFVKSRTAEDVFLDLKSVCISIKHKRGSTILATFWANVLQDDINFPTSRYSYKRMYDKNTGSSKLILKVEDMIITVFMKTGTMMIQGNYVYEWFKRRFIDIINAFDKVSDFRSCDYGTVGDDQAVLPAELHPLPVKVNPQKYRDRNPDFSSGDEEVNYGGKIKVESGRVDHYGVQADIHDVIEGNFGSMSSDVRLARNEMYDDLTSGLENLAVSSKKHGSTYADGRSSETLGETLGREAHRGTIRDGPSYVYPAWKDLLNKWFSEGHQVYIVSPFLDTDRLLDIIRLSIKHSKTAQLEAIYTRKKCDDFGKTKFSEIKQDVMKMPEFDAQQKLHIEYKVFNKCIYPVKMFHAKLIAGVRGDRADVFLTSANFHAHHFVHDNLETVQYLSMSKKEFMENYIKPLIESVTTST